MGSKIRVQEASRADIQIKNTCLVNRVINFTPFPLKGGPEPSILQGCTLMFWEQVELDKSCELDLPPSPPV